MKIIFFLFLLVMLFMSQGCSPEVGSKEWCESLKGSTEQLSYKDSMVFMDSCNASDFTGK